jgi:UDP-N-acetylglucosamine 4,6-dehydratase/5-epimerase
MLNNTTLLITGGTGSFGKKFIQIVLENYKPKKLIIFSRDELKQFEMSQRWGYKKYPYIQYILGDVRDRERVMNVFQGVDYVIHAAALKQVPAAEHNPGEYIKTNVIGAMNIIDAAQNNKVKKVIALSTDKACNPINLYGATKLCSDKLFTADNTYRGQNETRFAVVRYGNVLGSRGSVVPFFKERAKTGVLPITDPRMTRFWITLDQAVYFVIRTLDLAKGGEVFVPRIPSMRIVDLAQAIGPDCKHEVVGIRPGEKIHESLIGEDDARNTVEFNECYIIQPSSLAREKLVGKNGKGNSCSDGFTYTSDNNTHWMSVEELRKLIDAIADDYSIEQSRWSMEDIPQ